MPCDCAADETGIILTSDIGTSDVGLWTGPAVSGRGFTRNEPAVSRRGFTRTEQYLGCPSDGHMSLSASSEIALRSTPARHHVEALGRLALSTSTTTRAMPVSGWHRDLWFKPVQQGNSAVSLRNARHSMRVCSLALMLILIFSV